MDPIQQDYERLRTSSGVLPDLGLGLIELTGEDRLEWLQGQATNDLRGLASGERLSFCLCEATGQIAAVCDVWAEAERLLIATDSPDVVMRRAETMVILEDVVARDLSANLTLISVQGPQPAPLDLPGIRLTNDRLGSGGWDHWVLRDSVPVLERVSSGAYEVSRLEAGVPLRGSDYGSKTLPPELGPAFEKRYVSYTKGCYMGQEVLMRIHSRGHTNKTWVGLILEFPVKAGDAVSHSSREDAGVVTSAAVSPRLGPIAGATLRNEAAGQGETVSVAGVRGIVKHLPL